MNKHDEIEINLAVPESKIKSVLDQLTKDNIKHNNTGKQYEDPNRSLFEPFMIIFGLFALVQLATSVVKLVKDLKHGGLIIDTRESPPIVIEDASLDRGTIVAINKIGEELKVYDPKDSTMDDVVKLKEKLGKLFKC